jgi:hypothetical protein
MATDLQDLVGTSSQNDADAPAETQDAPAEDAPSQDAPAEDAPAETESTEADAFDLDSLLGELESGTTNHVVPSFAGPAELIPDPTYDGEGVLVLTQDGQLFFALSAGRNRSYAQNARSKAFEDGSTPVRVDVEGDVYYDISQPGEAPVEVHVHSLGNYNYDRFTDAHRSGDREFGAIKLTLTRENRGRTREVLSQFTDQRILANVSKAVGTIASSAQQLKSAGPETDVEALKDEIAAAKERISAILGFLPQAFPNDFAHSTSGIPEPINESPGAVIVRTKLMSLLKGSSQAETPEETGGDDVDDAVSDLSNPKGLDPTPNA